MRCQHCTNADPTLLEALDQSGFVVFCTVCAKTTMNRSWSAVRTVPHVNGRAHTYGIVVSESPTCGVLTVEVACLKA